MNHGQKAEYTEVEVPGGLGCTDLGDYLGANRQAEWSSPRSQAVTDCALAGFQHQSLRSGPIAEVTPYAIANGVTTRGVGRFFSGEGI